MLARIIEAEKTEMVVKVISANILYLGNKVLMEVAREKTVALMWERLESFYTTNSLTYMLCIKQELYTFQIVENKFIVEQLTNFQKIIDDLENI